MKSQNALEDLRLLKLQFVLCCMLIPAVSRHLELGDGNASSVRLKTSYSQLIKVVETEDIAPDGLVKQARTLTIAIKEAAYITAYQNRALVGFCLERFFPDVYKYSEDLFDAGFDGLVVAAINQRLDSTAKFSTYASSYIYFYMLTKLNNIMHSKKFRIDSENANWRRNETALEALENMSDTLVTPLSLDCRFSGRNPKVSHMISGRRSKRLCTEFSKKPLRCHIEDKCANWREPALSAFRKEAIGRALENLPKILADILILRFGLCGKSPHTIQECADTIGVSRVRIGQRIKEAFDLLIEVGELKEFFD